MNSVCRWRLLADSFPCLAQMIEGKRLPADYAPETLVGFYEYAALSRSERSIISFLLHVWNQDEFNFALSDAIIWDNEHRSSFLMWASGDTLGEPFRYFETRSHA